MFSPGLYAIADADHTPDVVTWGEALLAAGAKTLQLRAKSWSSRAITEAAHVLVERANHYGAVFILNDHPDIAAEVSAHGVHLGQSDMDITMAREIVGSGALIGLSTHSIEQVMRTREGASGADYLGFGPVFETSSKSQAGAARGVELLAEAVAKADLPLVAIGGISQDGLPRVIHSGASAWAAISALSTGDEAVNAIRALSKAP